jgi:hypothetical protein
MQNITEHYSEQKGERNASENSWVDLFVPWYTICVYDFLEDPCKFIQSKVSGFVQVFNIIWSFFKRQPMHVHILHLFFKFIISWNPNEPVPNGLTVLQHIQMSIDGSLFQNEKLVDLYNGHLSIAPCVCGGEMLFVCSLSRFD